MLDLPITHPLRVPLVRVRPAPLAMQPPLAGAARCPDCRHDAAIPDGNRRTCRACGWSG